MTRETQQAVNEWDEAERRISAVAARMYQERKIRNEKRARVQRLLDQEAARIARIQARRRARA